MVVTRGQTGSNDPATSTPSSAAPVRHTTTLAPTSDAGAAGWSEGRTTSANLMGGATGGSLTTQAGSCAKATKADPATHLRLPCLPTDDKSKTEPEDMYSQGARYDPFGVDVPLNFDNTHSLTRLDPHKDQWEKAVGGAVCGTRQMLPPWGPLVREADCCDEGAVDQPRQYQYGESRPFRLRQPADHAGASATITIWRDRRVL